MRIEVIRGQADRDGGVIYAPLLSTTEVLVSRGRLELEEGTNQSRVQLKLPFLPGLEPGQIVEVTDELNHLWRGKITAVKYAKNGVETSTLIEALRHEK